MKKNGLNDGRRRVCMIVQQRDVKGGIAAVTNGYYGSELEQLYEIRYVESYCDGSKAKKAIKALKAYVEFYKTLKRFKPELVHIHSSFGPSFYRLIPFLLMAKHKGIPVLDHCHGADFDSFYRNATEKKKRLIKNIFGRFDKMIVLSDEWKTTMSVVLPSDKLVVVSNYCKPISEEQVEKLIEKRFENRQILFLGEIGARKGGYDFADIIKNTVEKVQDAKFLICGSGSNEDENNIKTQIRDKKIDSNTEFLGWVRGNTKEKCLNESSLFMLPSYQEGLPMSILDAMAYGLPIVSTNVGGIPQLVESGKSGYLFNPGDSVSIADGICDFLTNKYFYSEASFNSLRIAKEKFGFENHLKKLIEIYDSLLCN